MLVKTETTWEEAKNILCIRLDTLGDVLMTTPAIRAVKESYPGRRITLLTSSVGAEAASLVPEIDDVIIYNAPWMKATSPLPDSRQEYLITAQLQQAGFDGAIIFSVFSQNPLPSAMLCHLANIPLRLAYCRENPYQLLTNWVKDPEPDQGIRHEVQRQLDLVENIGCTTENEHLSLRIQEETVQSALRAADGAGLDRNQPWITIHPGASAPSRRYPEKSYAAVILMMADHGYQVVLTGSQAERPLIRRIQKESGVQSFSMAGHLNLAELSALISHTPLLISNNTGPVHIAAAVGTPVVDLYALTNPQHTPWKVPSRVLNHDVPCKYCYKSVCPEKHHNCLRLVQPEEVFQAAIELLGQPLPVDVKSEASV